MAFLKDMSDWTGHFSQADIKKYQSLRIKIKINPEELPLALVSLLWYLNIVWKTNKWIQPI